MIIVECEKCGWRSEQAPHRKVTIAAIDHMLAAHPHEEPKRDADIIEARNILVELEN